MDLDKYKLGFHWHKGPVQFLKIMQDVWDNSLTGMTTPWIEGYQALLAHV